MRIFRLLGKSVKRRFRTVSSVRSLKENIEAFQVFLNFSNRRSNVIARYLEANSVTCTLDVGANIGQFGLDLRRMRYSGFILSFEPESKAFYKLTKLTKRDSAWECLQYGLGSEETTMLLNVAENDGLSSTFNNTKRNEKIPKIFVSTDHCEEVKIMKLDAFQNYFQNHESVFLKIDTQGFELEVLKGGLDSFEKITCVLMEASFVEQYYDQVSIHSLINMMHSLEFDLIDVFTHGYRNRMQIECDLFFSRKPRNSQ